MVRIKIYNIYIKPGSPQLNGKVERLHHIDQGEFYQLLTYKDDVDLNKKLEYREQFYNFDRPYGSFNGTTPSEKMRSLLKEYLFCPAVSEVLQLIKVSDINYC